jgi:hypothetical protein
MLDSTAELEPNKRADGRYPVEAKAQARSRLNNGKDVLPGVDGRSTIGRRFRDISCAWLPTWAALIVAANPDCS